LFWAGNVGFESHDRGQNRKKLFRFAPESGLKSDIALCRLSANSRHEQVQQNYRAVSEAMCPSRSKRRYPRRLRRQLRATAQLSAFPLALLGSPSNVITLWTSHGKIACCT